MNYTTTKQATCRAAKDIILMLSLLWLCPLTVPAGELSEVPDGPQLRLTLPDLAGQQRSLDEFEGKILLVNFWASWCIPCIEEIPGIQRLAEAMQEIPFAVIGVNVAEPVLRVRTAARQLGLGFPVLLDKDSVVFEGWGATVLPTAYVLDGSGRVRYVGRGPLEWDRVDIINRINHLVKQQPRHE